MNCQIGKHSVKEMKVLRYLPNAKVYEISVTWLSERSTGPTLFYLSEVFLYPYSLHPLNQETEALIGTQDNRSTQATNRDLPTCLQIPNSQDMLSRSSIFDFHQSIKEDIKRQRPTHPVKTTLDYDAISSIAANVWERQRRNEKIVFHSISLSQPKKRKKLE